MNKQEFIQAAIEAFSRFNIVVELTPQKKEALEQIYNEYTQKVKELNEEYQQINALEKRRSWHIKDGRVLAFLRENNITVEHSHGNWYYVGVNIQGNGTYSLGNFDIIARGTELTIRKKQL